MPRRYEVDPQGPFYLADADFSSVTPNIRTAGEIANGTVPINFAYLPGELPRYQLNPVPGTTDMNVGLQAAIDSASPEYPVVSFSNQVATSKPLLIRTTTQENITLRGSARVAAALVPTAIDIKQAAQNINCLIFNQNNNPHLHLISFQFFSTVAYTGICIYCKEGGGADSSGQAIFSCVFYDMWMGMPATANGFLQGGMQNCVVDTFNVEGCKGGCFRLEGAGCADNTFANIQFLSCFDEFISQVADTNGSLITSVSNLHAYQHMRGFLINAQNWIEATITGVILEVDATNVGGCGLFQFNNSTGLNVSQSVALARSGTVAGATVLSLLGTTSGKFSAIQINAAIGCELGAGTFDLEFENVDFTVCATACFRFNGNSSGTLRTRNCKFTDSQVSCFVHQSGTVSVNWYSENDTFLNAGLGGNAASRCIDVSLSGNIYLRNPIIGRDNGSAAGAFFIGAAGSGAFVISNPTFVGTPPSGIATGAQAITILGIAGVVTVTYSAAMDINAILGNVFIITATNGTAFTINAPGNPFRGMRITIKIRNTSGGALGVATFNAVFKMLAWTQPTNGNNNSIDFEYDGTNWVQCSPATANVPN